MAMKVIRSESGIATAGINVSAARPRKTKTTTTTSTNAMSRVSWTSRTERTIVRDRSYTGVMRTDPGSSELTAGSTSRTDLATSTALAPAWRKTARMTVAAGTS